VIEVGFRSAYPERAAKIANAVAGGLHQRFSSREVPGGRRASTWLSNQIAELRDRRRRPKIDRGFQGREQDHRCRRPSDLERSGGGPQQELATARAQTNEARVKLDVSTDHKSDLREATVTDTLRSEVVSKLRSHI